MFATFRVSINVLLGIEMCEVKTSSCEKQHVKKLRHVEINLYWIKSGKKHDTSMGEKVKPSGDVIYEW